MTYNTEFFDYSEQVDYLEKPIEVPIAPLSLQRTNLNAYYM
jgi:hypothetical protein